MPGLERGVAQVGVGFNFACALREAGDVWCWGETAIREIPGTVELRAAPSHLVVLLRNGTLRIHGPRNLAMSFQPRLPPGVRVVDLTLEKGTGCVLRDDGIVTCWGSNHLGQLGRATITPFEGVVPELGERRYLGAAPGPIERVTGPVRTVGGAYRHLCVGSDPRGVRCFGLPFDSRRANVTRPFQPMDVPLGGR